MRILIILWLLGLFILSADSDDMNKFITSKIIGFCLVGVSTIGINIISRNEGRK